MGNIHVLDGALADQIAAGEVVERPASVVKELLENAMDAGASAITVEIGEGGSAFIRVNDDGLGMDESDARLCVTRHATSKIRERSDLDAIRTLGFRGEALPAIASVSRFRLVTRMREAIAGTEVRIDGGAPPIVSAMGCAVGTTVEVRELFFNVPARKKFLKAAPTEGAQVAEVCLRAALVDPELRIVLLRDGKRAREFLPARDWAERATAVTGERGVRVEGSHAVLQLRALLCPPEDARTGATGLHMFVNGRAVRDRNLARSVAFAYGSVMPPGRYPVGVVHIDVDPFEVDVNVHPQKSEVRFARGREVHEALTGVLAKGLGTTGVKGPLQRGRESWADRFSPGPMVERDARAKATEDPWGLSALPAMPALHDTSPPPRAPADDLASPRQNDAPLPPPSPLYRALVELGATASVRDQDVGPQLAFSHRAADRGPLRAVAQLRNLYIIAESNNGMCVLDQHAADERVQYDRIASAYRARSVVCQRLLLPERVEVSEREAALIESYADDIAHTGLEVHLVHGTTAAVSAVPALLARARPERLLRDLLEELARLGDRSFGDAIDTALATMACHGSIRAGDPLSLAEAQALLDKLASIAQFGGHCPHGRPVLFEISFDDLARKVGR